MCLFVQINIFFKNTNNQNLLFIRLLDMIDKRIKISYKIAFLINYFFSFGKKSAKFGSVSSQQTQKVYTTCFVIEKN